MGEARWKTIDKTKLGAEIDKLSVEIDAITPSAGRTKDIALAVKLHGLTATHNALIAVLNSLD